MSEPRLKAGLWVSAALRMADMAGRPGAVLHKGDPDAGGVLAVLRGREGLCVLSQMRTAEGMLAWMRATGAAPVDQDAVSSSISLCPSPEMTKCTVSWWCRCMSELRPGGMVCRNISKVVVGSRPAIDSADGLCTSPEGSASSSAACTTTGRASTGRTVSESPLRNSARVKSGPDCAIRSSPFVRRRPSRRSR